jgi:hypothetical protein
MEPGQKDLHDKKTSIDEFRIKPGEAKKDKKIV